MARSTFAAVAVALAGLARLSTAAPASSPDTLSSLGLTAFPSPPAQGSDALTVNLGYGVYQGTHNATTNLNEWRGIGFAAPPVGKLRWQAPRVPKTNTTVVHADTFGPTCPYSPPSVPGTPFTPGNEDCLYLNVYAPASKKAAAADADASTADKKPAAKLPVLVYIHGGGYGCGDGRYDMSGLINDNNNEIVAVTIQYRLGAFGWLSSADVHKNGVVNAGLLDQVQALQWIQNYISLFGGDPDRVTISGESAGAGSVMYHALGFGGNSPVSLFRNGIAASPYLVPQYNYDAAVPTQRYHDFATAAGCGSATNIFACLVAADTWALQYASSNVSVQQTAYAIWPFVPVTDGVYVRQRPSVQLASGSVNGVNLLVGNNADEGALFVPGGISTDAQLVSWIHSAFPGLSDANVTALIAAYPGTPGYNSSNGLLFETNGISAPTANDVSQAGAGIQQRAYNMYAEATFVCPAYWLAGAFTPANHKKTAFQYQYSVPFAFHGSDLAAYLGPATANQGPNFVVAFRQLWGGLAVRDDPSIITTPNRVNSGLSHFDFPSWTSSSHSIVNLNQTGGVPVEVPEFWGGLSLQYNDPGLQNHFTVANAATWEGGRAQRCAFWKSVADYLPQ